MSRREEKVGHRDHAITPFPSPDALSYATGIIEAVCDLAGDPALLGNRTRDRRRLRRALREHDMPWLYEWLMATFSLQGISDAVATTFIRHHGNATWASMIDAFGSQPSCPKLQSFWHFEHCGYLKSRGTCSQVDHLPRCPLPNLPLRNGRLNQTAYSLFLFVRDVCDGDLVAWIDHKLKESIGRTGTLAAAGEAILAPMRHIHGVADKVLNMTLATLLMAAPRSWRHWTPVGSGMVAVDSLVHNFLHRTGILKAFEAAHAYGPGCYGENGCVTVISLISAAIDARRFNSAFPPDFPRFIQHAIWRYCAADGLNLCNGNEIDDDLECDNIACSIYSICRRIPLNNNVIIG